MHPVAQVASDDHNVSSGEKQAVDNWPLYTKGQWPVDERYRVNLAQLFDLLGQHEAKLAAAAELVTTNFTPNQLLTERKLRQVLAPGTMLPASFFHPNATSRTKPISITRKNQEIALFIAAQLRLWAAVNGCRLVTFTHSTLFKLVAAEFGCSESTYEKSLRLLTLAHMPTLCLTHTNRWGAVTGVSRSVAVILPALPRNANLEPAAGVPATSLARALQSNEQMTFETIEADPGPAPGENEINPPQVDTTVPEKNPPAPTSSARPTRTSPLDATSAALRTNQPRDAAISPGGQAGKEHPHLAGRGDPLDPKTPLTWQLIVRLWLENPNLSTPRPLTRAQRAALTRRLQAADHLLGRRALIDRLSSWIADLTDPIKVKDGPPPMLRWSFPFLTRELNHALSHLLTSPTKATPLDTHRSFFEVYAQDVRYFKDPKIKLIPAACATTGDGRRTLVCSGNHRAWQLLVEDPDFHELVYAAASCAGFDSCFFVSAGDRVVQLDPQDQK